MALWLVQRISAAGHDEHTGFVVRARNADRARLVAVASAHDHEKQVFSNEKRSTLEHLGTSGGPDELILASFNAG